MSYPHHVAFEVECIDRMYLNVYVPQLQYATGLVSYIHRHLGMPVASTAALAPVTEAFAKAVRAFALDRQIPWVDFAKGQRKDDVAHQYLDRFTGCRGGAVRRPGAGKDRAVPHPQTSPGRRQLLPVDCRRNWGGQPVLLLLRRRGLRPVLPEVLQLLPVQRKLCINGNEWAKRQAAKAGIGFTPLDNAFAAVDDVAALQAICDTLGPAQIDALLRKWLTRLPHPFSPADRMAGYRYDISILQAEFSLTQMLDKAVSGRIFFEQVIRDNLDLGRPDRVSLIFNRSIYRGRKNHTPGTFATRVVTDGVTPSLHVLYKSTKIKQYHKQGRALRTETTINHTMDFGLGKRLTNLPALRKIGYTANRRLLGAGSPATTPSPEPMSCTRPATRSSTMTAPAPPACASPIHVPKRCCTSCWCSGCTRTASATKTSANYSPRTWQAAGHHHPRPGHLRSAAAA